MVKKISLIFISITLILVCIVVGINFFNLKPNVENKQNIIPIQKAEVKINISPNISERNKVIPLPTEEDIIRNFFISINEKRTPEAISMMTPKMVGDDSGKQAWGVHFNAIKSISVASVDPSGKEDWKESEHTYKVGLSVAMKPESANAPIPYYGWGNGDNIRWVTLTKISSLWKISEIATGP